MSTDPLTLLHISAIALFYALAFWNFMALVREVRADAAASPAAHNNLSLYWPTTQADWHYRSQLFYGPQHRRLRWRMYGYALLGFVLLIAYVLPRIDVIPT